MNLGLWFSNESRDCESVELSTFALRLLKTCLGLSDNNSNVPKKTYILYHIKNKVNIYTYLLGQT